VTEDHIPEKALENESFLSRWSRLKQTSVASPREDALALEQRTQETAPLTDADMPPLESLDEHSDYRGFLSPKVSETLKQQALLKLFRSACFNVCDGLDDYDEDFTRFEKLGDVITADLRHRMERQAKQVSEKAGEERPAQDEALPPEGQTLAQQSNEQQPQDDSKLNAQGDAAAPHNDTDEQENPA
jgi:hypothetical protein